MKMKRNGMPAFLLAALTAICLLTACDNETSADDDAPAAGAARTASGPITTDTESNLVFTEGSAPSTWTYSLSYANE